MQPAKVLCWLNKSFSLVWLRAAAGKSLCCWVEITLRDSRILPEMLLKKHMKKGLTNTQACCWFYLWFDGRIFFWCVFLLLVVFLKTDADSTGYFAFFFVHFCAHHRSSLLRWRLRRVVSAEQWPNPVRVYASLLCQNHRLHSTHPLPLSRLNISFKFRFALCHLSLSVSYSLSLLLFHTFIELGLTSLSPLEPFRFSFTQFNLKLPLMIVIKQTFLNNEVAWHLYLFVQPTFSF